MRLQNRPEFFLAALLSISLLITSCGEEQAKVAPPPTVAVIKSLSMDIPLEKEFVGQVYGIVDIPIRARVEGFLEGMHFNEGRPVKKGQLLYNIDPLPFEAAVAEKKSRVAEANINAVNAKAELDRYEPLAEMNAVSKSDLDAARAEKGAADAAVEAAEAALDMAEINLGYTRLSSPINGLIGKTKARVGEFVGKDPNPVILNTVSRIDSIRVEFFITENDYLELARQYTEEQTREHAGHITEKENKDRAIRLILGDGSEFEHLGRVDFVDREVDPTTGSLLVQATFPNPVQLVRPGQFAKIRVVYEKVEDGILIPQRCVNEFQGRFNVFVVNDNDVIEIRRVTIGGTFEDKFFIREGLEAGERLVYEGLQKVSEGIKVNVEDEPRVTPLQHNANNATNDKKEEAEVDQEEVKEE